MNKRSWLQDTLASLGNFTDRPLVVKEKGVKMKQNPYENAWAVVTDISNVAVDAYIKGIPVVTTSESIYSSCGTVGLSKIEKPIYGDRDALFNWLAYNQFSLKEIKSGIAKLVLEEIYG